MSDANPPASTSSGSSDAHPAPRRSRRGWGRVALLLAVPPFLLECLLQLGALLAAAGAIRGEGEASVAMAPAATTGRTPCAALCLGDSFTYGVGSSDPSLAWPMQLAAALRQRPYRGQSDVVNAGWPGHTSRDVVVTLEQRLTELDPECVIVLVGVNDMWRKPDRLDDHERPPGAVAAGADRFRFEWRTWRLLQLLRQSGEAAALPDATAELPVEIAAAPTAPVVAAGKPDPLIGRWRAEEGDMTISADGSADLDGVAYRWTRRGGTIEFVAAGPAGTTTRSQLMVKERGIMLRPYPGTASPRRFTRVEAGNAGAAGVEAARDPAVGLSRLGERIAADPADVRSRMKRIAVAHAAGAHDLVAEDLKFFERAAAVGAAAARRELALALSAAGRTEEAGEIARELLVEFTTDATLWHLVGRADKVRGDVDRALEAVDRSLASADDDGTFGREDRLRFRAKLHGKRGDALAAVRDAVEAWSIDGLERNLSREVMLSPDRFSAENVATVAAALGLDAGARARLDAIVAASAGSDLDAPMQVLASHLLRVIEMCREREIEVFLLNYPTPHDRIGEREALADAQRRAAEQAGVPLIDIRGAFRRLMQEHRREEYFVIDGHCNDAGYAEMARLVGDALANAAQPTESGGAAR